MSIVNFILAIVALIIAILAYQRAGGTKELRGRTADALSKMEQSLRRIEKEREEEKAEEKTE
ncbi:MAG: hypothetical protein R6U38_03320 [Desulfatiglandaceae bacterium]